MTIRSCPTLETNNKLPYLFIYRFHNEIVLFWWWNSQTLSERVFKRVNEGCGTSALNSFLLYTNHSPTKSKPSTPTLTRKKKQGSLTCGAQNTFRKSLTNSHNDANPRLSALIVLSEATLHTNALSIESHNPSQVQTLHSDSRSCSSRKRERERQSFVGLWVLWRWRKAEVGARFSCCPSAWGRFTRPTSHRAWCRRMCEFRFVLMGFWVLGYVFGDGIVGWGVLLRVSVWWISFWLCEQFLCVVCCLLFVCWDVALGVGFLLWCVLGFWGVLQVYEAIWGERGAIWAAHVLELGSKCRVFRLVDVE